MKVVYPVDINENDDAASKYLKGASNRTGYYPIGRMNTWHGGVHFQGDKPIRVIADGKIIAFRVPTTYFKEEIGGRVGEFSNGFVLVQHDYESPKGQKLTFYSFYNHLTSLEDMTKNKIPNIFEGEIYKVRKDVKDTFAGKVGARLRKEPNVADNILALMPPEEFLEIAPEYIGKTGWLKVVNYGANELEGYCHDSSLEKQVVVTLKEDLCDRVNNVCMEVRAGTVIGFAGLNGFEKHEAHRAAHLEVFTADDVKDFLANSQKDGEDKKYYTKLLSGTELKMSLPVKVAKNSKVRLLSGSSENYQRVEIVNIEVTVNNRFEALGEYDSGNKTYEFMASQSDRIEAFNKVAGDIARVGDSLELLEQLEGKKRKVRHLNPASGRFFWVKKEMIEKKVITYEVPQEQDAAELGVAPEFAVMPAARELGISGAMPDSITETKDYDVLNTDLTEINILNPEFHERESRTLESDVVVNFKNGLEYSDADGKKWYLLEFKELKPNGVARYYKGMVKEEELSDTFSAYDWGKFGFRILEDVNNDYIYDFKNKSEFFKEICKLVDENKNGILEPFELQSALNNHYTADKLSKLVCKHHSEWAYGGRYFSALEKQVEQVLQKGIDLEEDEARKQELETLKKERMAAFDAKVKQLAIWEEIESRKGSYASKFVKGALLTNPLTTGGYLTYEGVKWLYRKFRSDEEIPLSPFPVNNPVVYHFHPIAFVEGMRRMGKLCNIDREFFFDQYAKYFGLVSEELKCDLEVIFEGIEKYETKNKAPFSKEQIAYILATIKHETVHFKPVIESFWSADSVRKKYYEEMYDPVLGKNANRRRMAKANGNTEKGDGVKYAGKGYVQITWKTNYQKAKDKFGVDFVNNPELALVPRHSINIALYGFDSGMFTGKSIHDYINSEECDYFNARRVINSIQSVPDLIKGYAEKFEKCLKMN